MLPRVLVATPSLPPPPGAVPDPPFAPPGGKQREEVTWRLRERTEGTPALTSRRFEPSLSQHPPLAPIIQGFAWWGFEDRECRFDLISPCSSGLAPLVGGRPMGSGSIVAGGDVLK